MKFAWIDAHGREFAAAELCHVVEVSVSDYQAWKQRGTPDRKHLTDNQLERELPARTVLASNERLEG